MNYSKKKRSEFLPQVATEYVQKISGRYCLKNNNKKIKIKKPTGQN